MAKSPVRTTTAFVSFEWNPTLMRVMPIFNIQPPANRKSWTIEVPIPDEFLPLLDGVEVKETVGANAG